MEREPLRFTPTERVGSERQPTDGLVVAGYVTGVLVPPVGFFVGFALVLKDRFAHGVAIMVLSVLVPLVVLAVVLPSSADASSRRHSMTFDFAVMVANQYWVDRGVFVHCHPHQQLLTRRQTKDWNYSVDMLSDVPGCMVEITPWAASWRTDRDLDQDYCWDIAHEVGHLAGLEHPGTPAFERLSPRLQTMLPGTVMNPAGARYPFGCTHPRKWMRRRRERSVLVPLSPASLGTAASRTTGR